MKRAEHAILLNGHPAFGRTVLKEGDVLRILVPEENGAADNGSAASIIPVQLPLDILYEDEDILVLNKPADMPVHPSAGNYENTLANGIINSRGKILSTAVSTGWTGILPEFLSWQKIP